MFSVFVVVGRCHLPLNVDTHVRGPVAFRCTFQLTVDLNFQLVRKVENESAELVRDELLQQEQNEFKRNFSISQRLCSRTWWFSLIHFLLVFLSFAHSCGVWTRWRSKWIVFFFFFNIIISGCGKCHSMRWLQNNEAKSLKQHNRTAPGSNSFVHSFFWLFSLWSVVKIE